MKTDSVSDTRPSLDEWRELYQVADDLKDLAPWQWMYADELIGIQNPATGQIGYACIMGSLGEFFGIAVYRGTEGLLGYLRIQTGEIAPDSIDAMFMQDCLIVSYDDRKFLDKPDLDLIKSLGLKYRGRNSWPSFRNHTPGLPPWYLTSDECRFMTIALEQVIQVAERRESDPNLLVPPDGHTIFTRIPEQKSHGIEWHDEWVEPKIKAPRFRRQRNIPAPKNPDRLWVQTKGMVEQMGGVWEISSFYATMPMAEPPGSRPYYPRMLLNADRQSGAVLGFQISQEPFTDVEIHRLTIEAITQLKLQPEVIEVNDIDTYEALSPLCDYFDINVIMVQHLPAIEDARRGLADHFMG